MVVMLPASLTDTLSSLGVEAESDWVQALARPLAPVAQPLLIASTLLLAVGALVCGRLPVAAAVTGGALLYLGMYVMTGRGEQTQPVLFYAGLAIFLAAPALTLWRPRIRACRPLMERHRARRALLGTLAASAVLLAAGPALGWGSATTIHARHLTAPETRGTPPHSSMAEPQAASPAVQVGKDLFVWSGTVEAYTARDAWFPTISTEGAVLLVEGEVRSGTLYIQLMDGQTAIVYEEELTAIAEGGLEIRVRGAAGVWMVILGLEGYSGGLGVQLVPLPAG